MLYTMNVVTVTHEVGIINIRVSACTVNAKCTMLFRSYLDVHENFGLHDQLEKRMIFGGITFLFLS